MNAYKFSGMPSNSVVAGMVTVLVSAWFALASGAILTDQHSDANIDAARAVAMSASEIPPEARMTIVVEARRSAANL